MKRIRQGQLRTAAWMLETDREYSVTPAIVAHYAPKGRWPVWHDYDDKAVGRPTYIKTGKTLAQRLEQYTKLCKQAGKQLTTERTHDSVILRNCSSWARFIQSEDVELDTLRTDHKKALAYWTQLADEMRAGCFYARVS